jgi:hypothetical protein
MSIEKFLSKLEPTDLNEKFLELSGQITSDDGYFAGGI